MSTTSFVTLPFVALISIPLAITAGITISFSILALFLQAAVVSIELCYALFTNLFTIPHSSGWSLLSFTASAPTTPLRRQSSDYGFKSPFPSYPTNPAFWSQSRTSPAPRRSGLNIDFQENPSSNNNNSSSSSSSSNNNSNSNTNGNTNNNNNHPPHYNPDLARRPSFRRNSTYSPSSIFHGFISGDEIRDFEGLGGWRCPPSSSKSLGHRSGYTSPSSSNGISDEVDDHAWISINSRLELPARPLTRRNSSEKKEPHLPWAQPAHHHHHRHHRRSFTTSMLSGLGARSTSSPSLFAATGREPNPGPRQQQQPPGSASDFSHLHNSYYLHLGRYPGVSGSQPNNNPHYHLSHSHNHLPDGSYFAIQTQAGSPNEEEKSAKTVRRVTHSPPGVRDRRRSISHSTVRVLPDTPSGEE